MLTTTDNPYDPRLDYNKWNQFDVDNGYHTASYLARVLQNYKIIDEDYPQESIDAAMQSIIDNDFLGIYKII